MSKEESTRHNDDEKNTTGLSNTVTAVTPVTIDSRKDEIGIILKEKAIQPHYQKVCITV